jgi:uncharacterized protein (DUF983 family)
VGQWESETCNLFWRSLAAVHSSRQSTYGAELMKHDRLLKSSWVLVLVGVLFVGHGMVLYRLSSHLAWTAVLVVIPLVLLKHVGLLGSVYAFFKRRSRAAQSDTSR